MICISYMLTKLILVEGNSKFSFTVELNELCI